MGITADVSEVWNELPVGHLFTVMERKRKISGYSQQNISSILCKFVKKRIATRGLKSGSYIKLKNYEPQKKYPTTIPEAFDYAKEPIIGTLTLGESLLAVIEELKNTIINLHQQLKEEKNETKVLIERLREMNSLYHQAQQKIIELNTGKSKGIKLSELHEFREGLPKR